MQRIIVAKEYMAGQIPAAGEYNIYRHNHDYFFTIGDGCTPINHLVNTSGHLVLKISEQIFNSLKKLGEKFPCRKEPYKYDEIDSFESVPSDILQVHSYIESYDVVPNVELEEFKYEV